MKLLKVIILVFHNLEKALVHHTSVFYYKKSTDPNHSINLQLLH